MAGYINTSYILDPSIGQPFTGYSLKFVQDSTKIMINSLVAAFAPDAVSGSTPVCLYGLQKTSLGGNLYSFQPGFVYIAGEVYPYFGTGSTTITNQPIIHIQTANAAPYDPLTFSDGIARNVHDFRYILITNGALNSGDANYTDLYFVANTGDTWHNIVGGAGFQSTWGQMSGTTVPVAYKKNREGMVSLKGQFSGDSSSTATVFTLPAGFRPVNDMFIPVNLISPYVNPNYMFHIEAATGKFSMQPLDLFNYATFNNGYFNVPLVLDGISFYTV